MAEALSFLGSLHPEGHSDDQRAEVQVLQRGLKPSPWVSWETVTQRVVMEYRWPQCAGLASSPSGPSE